MLILLSCAKTMSDVSKTKNASHYISRLPEGGSGGCSADVTIFSRGVGTAVKGES